MSEEDIVNDLNKLKQARAGEGGQSRLSNYQLQQEIKRAEAHIVDLFTEAKARQLIIQKRTIENLTEQSIGSHDNIREIICTPMDAFIPASVTQLYVPINFEEVSNERESEEGEVQEHTTGEDKRGVEIQEEL
jgi:hypothetical protein